MKKHPEDYLFFAFTTLLAENAQFKAINSPFLLVNDHFPLHFKCHYKQPHFLVEKNNKAEEEQQQRKMSGLTFDMLKG